MFNSLTNAGEDDHSQQESETSTDRVHHSGYKTITVIDVVDADTQNCAVGGDQGQEYTQRLMQRRHVLLQDDFYQLYQRSDYQDEYDGL